MILNVCYDQVGGILWNRFGLLWKNYLNSSAHTNLKSTWVEKNVHEHFFFVYKIFIDLIIFTNWPLVVYEYNSKSQSKRNKWPKKSKETPLVSSKNEQSVKGQISLTGIKTPSFINGYIHSIPRTIS